MCVCVKPSVTELENPMNVEQSTLPKDNVQCLTSSSSSLLSPKSALGPLSNSFSESKLHLKEVAASLGIQVPSQKVLGPSKPTSECLQSPYLRFGTTGSLNHVAAKWLVTMTTCGCKQNRACGLGRDGVVGTGIGFSATRANDRWHRPPTCPEVQMYHLLGSPSTLKPPRYMLDMQNSGWVGQVFWLSGWKRMSLSGLVGHRGVHFDIFDST